LGTDKGKKKKNEGAGHGNVPGALIMEQRDRFRETAFIVKHRME